MIGSKKLGDIGEQMAERVYAEDGFQILETNFRCRSGEIDIIAEKDFCFHFVEVKTRTGNGYGGARRAVNARKRALIRRGAAEWLRLLPEPVNSRYDVVEVLYREGMPPEFRHIRGAFGAKDLPAS